MHPEDIDPQYKERTAFVYLRQSSPGQVKHNVEGQERQLRMQDRVRRLGWPETQLVLLGGDTGNSGSSLHGREDFEIMLEAARKQTAGLIAARELSRLIRENQDWNYLVRVCRYQGVLLCDEYRVYDANDPQDRMVLGIQGTFFEFELSMLQDRMQASLRQKAERGEQYDAFPPGYVCRRAPHYEKHPDERVQRAVERVFAEFDGMASVYALYGRLRKEGFQLPIVPHGHDWRDVEWVTPSYAQLLTMLKNPTYAGIYARGRKKTFAELDEQGHVVKRQRRVPRDQWDVFLEQHHAAYIDKEVWERNVQKIERNSHVQGSLTKRSPGRGASLLAGLLRCRRCGHVLQVDYPSGASQGVRYACRAGARQRDAQRPTCFSFVGQRLEDCVSELLLDVVRPAGIEAAKLAAERIAADRDQRRRLLVDRWDACREAEARAEQEYKATDTTYATVRRKLAAEWNETLEALHAQERRLATFDAERPLAPTREQLAQLDSLASDLSRAWFDRQADAVLKKEIARTLIEEIIVDVDESRDELQCWIHWSGGHHTELYLPRRGRCRRWKESDLKAVIGTLRKVLDDVSIATALNRERIPTPQGSGWTKARVATFRRQHQIPVHSVREKATEGWLTQAEAATRLGISPMSLSRLVHTGVIPAEQPKEGIPSVIREQDLSLPRVQHAVNRLKSFPNRPLPADPNQLSLFPTTKL